MKQLLASVMLLAATPCVAASATWDDMLKDQPVTEQEIPAEILFVNILGKPVVIPTTLGPNYVERLQNVAPVLASACPGFAAHQQALGKWSILPVPSGDEGVILQVQIIQAVPQFKLPAKANCFYEILPDSTFEVAKSSCRALCKDSSSSQNE